MLVCTVALLLAGCATAPGANPRDPWEPMNRGIFQFNETFDEVAFKPTAIVYKTVTPRLVRAGVTNFFNNLGDAWSLFNNVLQGKPRAAVETYFRITVNTFWGMGGVFDVATEIGVESHTEDFGQTLGLWGIPTGPYLVSAVLRTVQPARRPGHAGRHLWLPGDAGQSREPAQQPGRLECGGQARQLPAGGRNAR
jgi:phospholipid-binding lipoprotein MlaA